MPQTPHIDKLRALFIEQVTTVKEKYEKLAKSESQEERDEGKAGLFFVESFAEVIGGVLAARSETKSLSQNSCCVPSDDGACEVEHGLIVVRLLFPADQEATKAVDPRVAAFNDPSPCFPARVGP